MGAIHFIDRLSGKHLSDEEIIEYAEYLYDHNSSKPFSEVIKHVKICDECAKKVLNKYYELYLKDTDRLSNEKNIQ